MYIMIIIHLTLFQLNNIIDKIQICVIWKDEANTTLVKWLEKNNNKPNDSVVQLKKEHLLVPDSDSEDKFIDYLKKSYNLNKFDVEIIYLLFNTGCNLKCKYCYVEGSSEPNFKNYSMDKQTFDSLIEYLDKLIKLRQSLDWSIKIIYNRFILHFLLEF